MALQRIRKRGPHSPFCVVKIPTEQPPKEVLLASKPGTTLLKRKGLYLVYRTWNLTNIRKSRALLILIECYKQRPWVEVGSWSHQTKSSCKWICWSLPWGVILVLKGTYIEAQNILIFPSSLLPSGVWGSTKLPLLMSKAIYIATPGQQEVPPDSWIYHIGNLLLIRLEVPAGENKPAKIQCYLHKLCTHNRELRKRQHNVARGWNTVVSHSEGR